MRVFCKHSSAWRDIYTISHPRRLLGILVHSEGGTKKELCSSVRSSAAGPHWLTAEHQLHTELVSSPAVQHRRVFISPPCQVCWCHHVRQCIDAISLLQQSQVGGKEVTSTGVTIHAGGGLSFKMYLCIYIFYILYWVFSHTVWYIKCDHNPASFLPSTPTSLPKQRQSFYLHSPPQTSWGPHQLSCSHLFIYLFE